jgi:transposase
MTNKNQFASFSKISEYKIRQIVKLFSYDLTAIQIAQITRLNRNTVNRYLKAIRKIIAEYCEQESPFLEK